MQTWFNSQATSSNLLGLFKFSENTAYLNTFHAVSVLEKYIKKVKDVQKVMLKAEVSKISSPTKFRSKTYVNKTTEWQIKLLTVTSCQQVMMSRHFFQNSTRFRSKKIFKFTDISKICTNINKITGLVK